MIITDTFDSRILFTLMLRSVNSDTVLNYRRRLGWIIVYISFIVGGYKIFSHVFPGIEIKENDLTLIGVGFFILMILFYIYILISRSKNSKNSSYGN